MKVKELYKKSPLMLILALEIGVAIPFFLMDLYQSRKEYKYSGDKTEKIVPNEVFLEDVNKDSLMDIVYYGGIFHKKKYLIQTPEGNFKPYKQNKKIKNLVK